MRVTLDDVGFRYADRPWLFRKVKLELHPGHVYAVTGRSGSGKSTFLSVISGDRKSSEGHVYGVIPARVQWVFQTPHGEPYRTVLDHVALPFIANGAARSSAEAEACALLDEFGLHDLRESSYSSISGGQAQRLMLARAIACKPTTLLVDEPTAQLDTVTARSVDASLQRLAKRGVVVVVATHDSQTSAACTDVIDISDFCPDGLSR